MKNVKILFTLMALFFFANASFAQSAKMEAKAKEKVEELNQLISSQDNNLALSEEQQEKILAIEIKKRVDIKAINKSDASEEDKKMQKKEVNKSTMQDIMKNILTKEQRQAFKAAKAAKKAAKS